MIKKFLFITIVLCVLFSVPHHGLHADDEASEYIKRMTLPQKIGQIMLIGIPRKILTSRDVNHLKKINPGGIVFYGRNFKDASDIPPLISKIKHIFNEYDLPLFFAIDQEGGIVHRIKGENYKPPSATAIGTINSEEFTREVAKSVGSTLRSLGIYINFAPVLDVPVDLMSSPMLMRSYSSNPKTVTRLGNAYISGLHDVGILATAKHFPGIGRTHEDSHITLPRITWETLDEKKSDLMPFRGAIQSGVDIIMVGHFIAEPGDSKNPISLSSYWMTDVLRKELEFKGLILVDNIEMKPIEDNMSISEASVQSFKAGADIIMVSHERKKQEEVFNALMKAVQKGDISIERLNVSLGRIIEAKKRMLSNEKVHEPSHDLKDILRLSSENSITVLTLKDAPLSTINKEDKVLFTGYNTTLFNTIKDTFKHTDILNTTLLNYKKLYPEIPLEEFIRKFDAIIIDALYSDASEIISICNDLNVTYAMVLSNPLNIQKILERFQPKCILITYENNRVYLKTAMEVITGVRRAKGRLPYTVNLPINYKYMD